MSTPPPFAHLHVHSEFSILDGACQIKPMVERVGELGMEHIGLTDHGTMAGTVELYNSARKQGIQPILGIEAYVTPDHRAKLNDDGTRSETTHLTLLAESEEGFRNLMQLSSKGCLEGMYYKPRIDYDWMSEHSKGVIALTGCMASKTQRLLANGDLAGGQGEIDRLANIFGKDNVYVEFQDAKIPEQREINQLLMKIQRDQGLQSVVTSDVHYLMETDAKPHGALLCIQTKDTLSNPNRFRFSTDEFWLKSPQEMWSHIEPLGWPAQWMANSVDIAERCRLDLTLGETMLPEYPWTEGMELDAYLAKTCQEGMQRRYGTVTPELQERLDFELGTISRMGYSAYFLITWDWINWAKENGIAIGPGRGSAAGSLVAYTLGITDVDPIHYDLLFERFLNPDRISMPDIDTDVSVAGRERCINYLAERYGRDRVAQIATFGRMAPKAAVKDAARVMEYPVAIGDRISKLIPDGPGQSFKDNMKPGADLRKAYDEDETVRKVVDMAMPLEGVVRNAGIHAAAVVIGARPLMESAPLRGGEHGDQVVTQVAQNDAELLGLLKMDVLGLRNLDVLEKVVQFVKEGRGVEIDVSQLPLDDEATLAMIGRGECAGVFQLESDGMQAAARQVRTTRFEDIVALVALYRPGPMEYIPKFAANKRDPESIRYGDERLRPILEGTYGITIYQEQYMLIAKELAGFTGGEADNLRKGIAKKLRAVLDEIKPKFLEGCANNGVPAKVAAQLWEDAEKAGDYSFNKSHAVCYALIAYQTAWLKCHYPAEYMAALVSTVMHTKDRVPIYIAACHKMGLEVLPADVNESLADFKVVDRALRFGLMAVKGVGEAAVEAIVRERTDQPFTSIWDFCERVDKGYANKRVLEALIKAGAFDSTGDSRKGMLAVLPQAMALGAKSQADAAAGQFDLFGDMGGNGDGAGDAAAKSWPAVPLGEFPTMDKLDLEKEATGLYMSGHPLDDYVDALASRIEHQLDKLEGLPDKCDVRIGGIVTGYRPLVTKKGDPMAFCAIEDQLGNSVRVVVLPKVFEASREKLQRDRAVVIVKGRLDANEGRNDVVAEEVIDITDAPALTNLTIRTDARHLEDEEVLLQLQRIMANYSGDATVDVRVSTAAGEKVLRLGAEWKVSIDHGLKHELRELLGHNSVT